jgi:hypothetical protein
MADREGTQITSYRFRNCKIEIPREMKGYQNESNSI